MPKDKFKHVTDRRIMEVLTWYQYDKNITMGEVCKTFKIDQGVLSPIKSGLQSFTIKHILSIAKVIKNINVNYLFGLEENMIGIGGKVDPLENLKAAVKMVEQKYK